MSSILSFLSDTFFLVKEGRSKLLLLLFLFLFLSIFDLIGLGFIGLYVSLISGSEVNLPQIVQKAFDFFMINDGKEEMLLSISFLLIAIFFFKFLYSLFVSASISYFALNYVVLLRNNFLKSLNSMDYLDFISINSSEYLQIVNSYISEFTNVLRELLHFFSNLIVSLSILCFLFFTSVYAFLILMAIIILFGASYEYFLRRRVALYGEDASKAGIDIIQSVTEGIGGYKELLVLGKANYFWDKTNKFSKVYVNKQFKTELISMFPKYALEFFLILFLSTFVILSTSGFMQITNLFAILSVFAVASVRLLPMIGLLAGSLSQISFRAFLTKELVRHFKRIDLAYKNGDETSMEDMEFNSIEFKKINFRYPGKDKLIFEGLDLQIKKGEIIGIMGESGAGKSSFISLLLGLLKPDSGNILINGIDNAQKDKFNSLRNKIAYLPQEIFITDDTIINNVALGEDPEDINLSLVLSSLDKANLGPFISSLPLKGSTVLGERGVNISGGQRQRIALARAFYFNKDILILDEATSSLDNKTENSIVDSIKNLKGINTILIIAHRTSTLKYCDIIYRLEEGNFVEYDLKNL